MKQWFDRLRSRTAAFAHDLLAIPLAWGCAYWLRFNLGPIPEDYAAGALHALPWVILIQGSVFWAFGLYRGVWRFASLPDLVRILQAVLVGTLLIVTALFVVNRMALVPRSVPVLFIGLEVLLLAGPRLLYRWLKDRRLDLSGGQRVLIVGAGRAGEMLARDLLRDPRHTYVPAGFVDDTPRRQGGEVHGLPILGPTARLETIVERQGIDVLMLAVPGATPGEMRRLVDLCERTGRPFRTLPHLRDLISGQISLNALRPVSIEDLLGRAPVQLDGPGIRAGIAGQRVLISGAGGSIGSELVRQLIQAQPARLILVERSEFNLYRIETELSETWPQQSFGRYLLDVSDARAMSGLFARERPTWVFHAAAYKHVPLLEDQPGVAVLNNVRGTQVLAETAIAAGCQRFVLISTDKAVHPANVMGATKRLAEMLCQALAQGAACRFITVRFGNVLDSAGSVVPRFRQQIARGGPVTVTHPDITRFFMTIPEACQLIMEAAAIGDGGEIFVLDMGDPIPIRYLAEQMIRLSGREPGREIAIEYTGLRPGEKLYEELFYASEDLVPTRHPKIRVARGDHGELLARLRQHLPELLAAAEGGENDATLGILRALLPEWRSGLEMTGDAR